MAMVRVVMLTSAAGPGLDLQFGDVFETDQATADRLLEYRSAREVTAEDEGAPVKRESPVRPVAIDELQASETRSQVSESNDATDESNDATEPEDASTQTAPAPAPARRTTRRR